MLEAEDGSGARVAQPDRSDSQIHSVGTIQGGEVLRLTIDLLLCGVAPAALGEVGLGLGRLALSRPFGPELVCPCRIACHPRHEGQQANGGLDLKR
jgi:hypothetical protein